MAPRTKQYEMNRVCTTQIKGFAKRGYSDCVFTATLYRDGKKLVNALEDADVSNFGPLIRDQIRTEEPDSIKLIFHGYDAVGKRVVVYNRTFELTDTPQPLSVQPTQASPFAGFGEVEVMQMVDRKVDERVQAYTFQQEMERTRMDLETAKRECADLLQKNEELLAKVDAQSTIETYANIAGKAAPILSAIFGSNPLVSTATSLLAGVGKPGDTEPAAEGEDSKSTIIRLIDEFLIELSDPELAELYTIMSRIQEDRTLIPRIARSITPRNPNPSPSVNQSTHGTN